ncbi:hypothetical protein D3C78_1512320 [compost metagenome]
MNGDQFRVTNFHPQVTPGHHHAFRCFDDLIENSQVIDGFCAFNLGNQAGLPSRLLHQATSQVHIRGVAWKRDSQVIHLHVCSRLDIGEIFFGQRRCRQSTAFAIDPLVVGERPAYQDFTDQLRRFDFQNLQLDSPVIE